MLTHALCQSAPHPRALAPTALSNRWLRVLLASAVLGLLWFALLPSARAQAVDEAHWVAQGDDAVLQIHLNVRVQYQRYAPLQASDVIELYFLLLGADESLTRPIEEVVSVAANQPAPRATLSYPPQSGLPVKKLVIRLEHKVDFKVRAGRDNQSLELVLPGMAPRLNAQPVTVAPEPGHFAISLQRVPLAEQAKLTAVPASAAGYDVFGAKTQVDGQAYYEVMLGYFDTEAAATAKLQGMLSQFPQARVIDLRARTQSNLQAALPPAGVAAGAPMAEASSAQTAAPVASAPDTDTDKLAAGLMTQARSALVSGKPVDAVSVLTQLLLLPPNKYSRDAQELVGLARERAGDLLNARKEYELYLKLFPAGEGATRVRQRLASMAPPEEAQKVAAKPAQTREPVASVGGSVTQAYYGGRQSVQTVFLNVPVTVNQQTISNNVQSSLTTSVDLNGRYRTESSDTRVVIRDTDQYSFINAVAPSINRMDSVFVDYKNLDNGLSLKAGRQSGVTGGLVGRFDGVVVGGEVLPRIKVNVVAGVPVAQDQFVQTPQSFEGVSVEAQNYFDHWGGSAYVINQNASKLVDRRAVGGDLRYFDPQKTLFSQVDYDVEFRTLNAATLQGTYQFPDQTSLSLLLDDRKAPTLTTSNGLLAWGCSSYAQFFAGTCQHAATAGSTVTSAGISAVPTLDNLRQAALATTANAHQISFDVSRPLGKQWQASFDIRNTSVGALPTVVINGQTFQGTSATGNVLSLSAQVTGTNLYSRRDINVISTTHLHSSQVDGTQIALNNLNTFFANQVSVGSSLAYYWENDKTGQSMKRITPSMHSSYKLTRRISLDATVSWEHSANLGPIQTDTTANLFFFVGYRYDLN